MPRTKKIVETPAAAKKRVVAPAALPATKKPRTVAEILNDIAVAPEPVKGYFPPARKPRAAKPKPKATRKPRAPKAQVAPLTTDDYPKPPSAIVEDPDIRPSHYQVGGLEAITVIDAWELDFDLGSVVKYLQRHKMKGGLTDLRKAQWYLNHHISKRIPAVANS